MVQPNLDPSTGRMTVDCLDYRWVSSREHAIILEYGPGVAGAKWFDLMMNALAAGEVPLQYIGVSNGPFANQFLVDSFVTQLEERLGSGMGELATSGQLFIPREDGMVQATKGMLATPQATGTHEICDLILLTAVHKADPRQLEQTIALSPQLLRPDGRLLLSAPLTQVGPGMTTFGQELEWARQAGYTVEWQGQAETGDAKLGTATTSGFAALRK